MDRHVWDGLVRAIGGLGQIFGTLSYNFDERGINAGVDEATTGTRGLGRLMSCWHSGQIQTYLRAVGVSVLVLLVLTHGSHDHGAHSGSARWRTFREFPTAESSPGGPAGIQRAHRNSACVLM